MTDVTPPPRVLVAPELVGDTWNFPPAWTEIQRERFEAAKGETIARGKECAAIQEKAAGILASPEMLIEIAEGEAAEMRRAAEYTRRQAEGEIHWLKMRAKMGGDVRRIDGEEGDVIVLRRMSESAIEDAFRLMNEIGKTKRDALPPNASPAAVLAAERDALMAMRGTQQDAVVANAAIAGLDEKESARRLRALMAKYWGLWPEMIRKRDEMITGYRTAEGKDSAPS